MGGIRSTEKSFPVREVWGQTSSGEKIRIRAGCGLGGKESVDRAEGSG